MNDFREDAKLVQVARMYYEENLTQAEIARRIEVSRPLVSKMLTRAKELGIVKIEIRSLFHNNNIILDKIKNSFNIKGGMIVPQGKSEFLTKQTIYNRSVEYISEEIPHCNTVGIGWGYTIGELIDEIDKNESSTFKEGYITPLIGTANIPNKSYHPNDLVRSFSSFTGMKPKFIYAPAFPTTVDERELYMGSENFKEISAYWEELDFIIMSIGDYPSVPDQATALRFGKKLSKEKALGKFLSYYFNGNGDIIFSKEDHVIHIPLDNIKRCRKVLAICTNTSAEAVIGALRTGFITHIIMDEKLGEKILNLL